MASTKYEQIDHAKEMEKDEEKDEEIDKLISPEQKLCVKFNLNGHEDIKQSEEMIKESSFSRYASHPKSFDNPIDPQTETFELPRDILTAFIIIKLENDGQKSLWNQYSFCGKAAIYMAVMSPLIIQYFVAVTLIIGIDFDEALDEISEIGGEDIWFNLVTLAILFIYMLRDVHGYTANVWNFIARVEKNMNVKYNPLHVSRLGNMFNIKRWDYHNLDPKNFDVHKQEQRIMFITFRLLIIAVFVLYGMVSLYSVLQIAFTSTGLEDKLDVSLKVFFLLEVDDWSYDLFFSQNGILEDHQFDITFPLEIEDKHHNKFKKDTKKLWKTICILGGSLLLIIIGSAVLNVIPE